MSIELWACIINRGNTFSFTRYMRQVMDYETCSTMTTSPL